MRIMTIAAAVAVILGFNSCSIIKNHNNKKEADVSAVTNTTTVNTPGTVKTIDDEELDGEWTIVTVNGKKVTGEERPSITFQMDGHNIYGNTGCNIINGNFMIGENNGLQFSGMLSTMKACPDAPFETAINQALDNVRHFNITKRGNEYYVALQNAQLHTVMVLRKHNMNFLNGTWRAIEINGQRISAERRPEMVIDIPELTLHGNSGCNLVNGGLRIDPDKSNSIQFENLITTRMACDSEGSKIETAYLVALESTEFAKKSGDNNVVLSDKNGKTTLVLQREEVSK